MHNHSLLSRRRLTQVYLRALGSLPVTSCSCVSSGGTAHNLEVEVQGTLRLSVSQSVLVSSTLQGPMT
jgi:hypothetical protein